MKSVKLVDGKIVVSSDKEPMITSPTAVKIKIAYSSVCGYDVMMYRGDAPTNTLGHIGHEGSGTVIGIGSSVTDFRIGDHVTINVPPYCHQCDECRKGNLNFCQNIWNSIPHLMSEYVVYNQNSIFKLPSDMDLKVGCLMEPLTMAMCSIQKASLSFGTSLLILGGGAMGLMMLKLACLTPAGKIIVVEPSEKKRQMALSFGASAVIDPYSSDYLMRISELSDNHGFDAVIEASGSTKAAKLAFSFLANGGRLVLFGLYRPEFELPINPLSLYWKDASIHAVHPPSGYFIQAINMAHRLKLDEVITAVFPYADAAKAFAEKASGRHAKVVLDFTTGI